MVLHGFDKQIRCEGFIQESNHVAVGDVIGPEVRAEARHIDHRNIGRRRILEQFAAYFIAFHVGKKVIEQNQVRRAGFTGAQTFLSGWRDDNLIIGFGENFFHEAQQHQTVVDHEHFSGRGLLGSESGRGRQRSLRPTRAPLP